MEYLDEYSALFLLPPPPPPPPPPNPNTWTTWTRSEDKAFEHALEACLHLLAEGAEPNNGKWDIIAQYVPGKTAQDVFDRYNQLMQDLAAIESGTVPIPNFKDDDSHGLQQAPPPIPKVEMKKRGTAWTQREHRLFLIGLSLGRKGDWQSISRKFVTTRTPMQVASHHQKYNDRQQNGGKSKRKSIHDVTVDDITTEELDCWRRFVNLS